MSDISYCRQCGQANLPDNNFCAKCGNFLTIANIAPLVIIKSKSGRSKAKNKSTDDEFECIRCDTVVPVGTTKCPKCGLDFFPEDKEEDKVDSNDDSDKFECIRCDTIVSVGTTKCPKCGLNFFPEDKEEDKIDLNGDNEIIRRPAMSNQAQCPNCSGYKLDTNLTKIDPETGKKIGSGCGTGLLVSLGGMIIFGLVALILDFLGAKNEKWLVVPFLSYIGFMGWFANKENQRKKRAYNLYNFYCQICGNRWEWREGTPYPKVKVDPELIAKGNQLLEEQQRQQDAAALNYLLNKDK